MTSTLTSAANTITAQIAGLEALRASLGAQFEQVVSLLLSLEGRLIVTGMGKSGHIARKIAATMASTGTPAYFVHPAEASHGDLGMIGAGDAILALSNSGETKELADIIAYAKRFSIPLIAMTRKSPSSLADAADHLLLLPDSPEASPVNAPTTSTTQTLALGDALAVALLEQRGFTREEFSTFHPGGKLGQALQRVCELMHDGDALPLVSEQTPMQEVLLTMTAGHFGTAGVLDKNGALVGVITDGDLRRHMGDGLLTSKAADIMTAAPKTISFDALATEALALMQDKSITSLFVVESGMPVGIIHIHDFLREGVI